VKMHRLFVQVLTFCAGMLLLVSAQAAETKPNILVIFGDDVGITNVSAYGHGIVGYQTPNIDRIAREGMLFIDYYGQQSCTAGRSAFITGNDWWYRHSFYAVPTQAIVGNFLSSFVQFPPRQKPGSFTVDKALEALSKATPGSQ